jgi:hypothetical protein
VRKADLAAPHNYRQRRSGWATEVQALQFFLVFLCPRLRSRLRPRLRPRALEIIQKPLPGCQLYAQSVEIEVGKRGVRTVQIPQRTLQNRARTHMVVSRSVMKSDRQLNQPLYMLSEMPARGPVARQRAPDVFENFMSVEKVGSVEKIDASVELPAVGRYTHSGPAFSDCGALRRQPAFSDRS